MSLQPVHNLEQGCLAVPNTLLPCPQQFLLLTFSTTTSGMQKAEPGIGLCLPDTIPLLHRHLHPLPALHLHSISMKVGVFLEVTPRDAGGRRRVEA